MQRISAFAETAALMGDPARANMLFALMDGRALTAGELARFAGATPQTASGHLARLAEAGMIVPTPQGRHRYFRLASPAVAQMVESVMGVAEELSRRPLPLTGPRVARGPATTISPASLPWRSPGAWPSAASWC
ncbi:ArsR/SmtB family transcription factor [Sphingomonas sp. Sphisp66]|uniref:ArsR/SmtB family transcription factor n=1 Tax=Sphingomonas sp. Sphisp66 TaxID=3243051 RepID=UPI0039B60AD8